MAYHCPACSLAILSRRNKLCGFCGEPLPAELLFTPAQIEKIEADEKARSLASKLREEKRAEAARLIAEQGDFGGRRAAAQPVRMKCISYRTGQS